MGLNTAVMVRSGVGNTIGVGDETNGKLQASIAIAKATRTMIGIRLIFFTYASQMIPVLSHHYKSSSMHCVPVDKLNMHLKDLVINVNDERLVP